MSLGSLIQGAIGNPFGSQVSGTAFGVINDVLGPMRSKDGIAIWIKITAGIIVQIHSIICLSSKFLLINEFNIIVIIINITNVIINTKIILMKSCKKINSSIIGELASCKPN